MNRVDVLIVGAGPTGLLIGSELCRHGLSVRIIDKKEGISGKSKAIVLQPRTLEIFAHLEIEGPFLKEGLKLKRANPMSHSHRIGQINFDKIESPFPYVLSIEQSKTEKFLETHLTQKGVTIEWNVELTHLEESEDLVEATLNHLKNGEEEKAYASWIIGCDGAHSFVRKSLNLPFEGKVFADVFSLADVHIEWKYPHDELFFFLESQGAMGIFPLPDENRYRLIFQLERCRDVLKREDLPHDSVLTKQEIPDPTIEEAAEMLHKYADPEAKITDPIWLANFHINSRLTSAYQKGRRFLAGDAAHIHSPVGGQGMNTGFQDAFNLAWKLAYVHHKKAPLKFIESYHRERHQVAHRLLKATELGSSIATMRNPIGIFIRNHLIRFLMKSKAFQKRLASAISQISIKYRKSQFIKEKGHWKAMISVGVRAPNSLGLMNDREVDFYTLWKNTTNYHLLLFSGKNPNLMEIEILKKMAESLILFSIVPILVYFKDQPFEKISNGYSLSDPTGKTHEIYGIKKSGCYLIRPDIHIAYRQTPFNPFQLSKYLKRIFSK